MPSKKAANKILEWIQKRQASLALILAIISTLCSIYVIWIEEISAFESGQLRSLIEDEARAAKDKNIPEAVSLFTEAAIIHDANANTEWDGIDNIRGRYQNLPQFCGLAHLDINIDSVSLWDGTASASSATVGQIVSNGTTQAQVLFSKDSWKFKKVNGQWKISVFVINQK